MKILNDILNTVNQFVKEKVVPALSKVDRKTAVITVAVFATLFATCAAIYSLRSRKATTNPETTEANKTKQVAGQTLNPSSTNEPAETDGTTQPGTIAQSPAETSEPVATRKEGEPVKSAGTPESSFTAEQISTTRESIMKFKTRTAVGSTLVDRLTATATDKLTEVDCEIIRSCKAFVAEHGAILAKLPADIISGYWQAKLSYIQAIAKLEVPALKA